MRQTYSSVEEFLQEWVNLRPVTFFEITCNVDKARENCQREIALMQKRGELDVEVHVFGRRAIPVYKLRRQVILERETVEVEFQV
jgi:hypothetical protein